MQQHATNTMAWSPMATRTSTYADVMSYLHGIDMPREVKKSVGRQLLFEAENENQSKILNRLDYLSTLREDWDGYGAMPVSPIVIDNLKEVISLSNDGDWALWMISPETNGALCLQSKQHTSSISVGSREFSYYSFTPDSERGESHIPFTAKQLLNIMRMIV